jgi:hypothetical protein
MLTMVRCVVLHHTELWDMWCWDAVDAKSAPTRLHRLRCCQAGALHKLCRQGCGQHAALAADQTLWLAAMLLGLAIWRDGARLTARHSTALLPCGLLLPLSPMLSHPHQGFRGRGGTTTQRLDGAIYAASNAAMVTALIVLLHA